MTIVPDQAQQHKPVSAPSPIDEAAFLARLKAGDDAAFNELVKTHSPRMLAVARRICPAEAEDVLQEAFLSVFQSIDRFDGRSQISTWLHRITVNAALMRRRRNARRPVLSIDALQPRLKNGFFDHTPPQIPAAVTPEGGLDIQQKEALWAAIDRLPNEYREVLVLRDIEGLESSAVAASVGITDALTRQRLHRARLALVKLLDGSDLAGLQP